MAFTLVPSAVTGNQYSAPNYNTQVKANLNTMWVYTTAGDLSFASSPTALSRLAIGATGQYLGVTAGVPAWKNDGVPGMFTAAGDLVYGSALDTSAILNKPTASVAVLQETSSGVPSWKSLSLAFHLEVVAHDANVGVTSVGYFFIPSSMNNMVLVEAKAFFITAGSPESTYIQVRNVTKYSSFDALSTPITVLSGAVSGSGVINTSYDDVSTNDKIIVYVAYAPSTAPKGLQVDLRYQLF